MKVQMYRNKTNTKIEI